MQAVCTVHASFLHADSFGVSYALWCAVWPCFQAQGHPTVEAATAAAYRAAAEWFLDAAPFGITDARMEAENAAAWAALQAWLTSIRACPNPAAHAEHAALYGDGLFVAEPEQEPVPAAEPRARGFIAGVMATIDAMNEDDEEEEDYDDNEDEEEDDEERKRLAAALDAQKAAYAEKAAAPAA
jgi:hypothetical protein